MTAILERAAADANAQMRVQSFADRRADRAAWPDRQWEWASLRPENGTFDAPTYIDLTAREKWFFQAQVESPARFRRTAGAGSLYWLGTRDATGAFLDGGNAYRLVVPHPVPGKLFWSVTVYDTETRSEIDSGQGHAALRSLFELKGGLPARTSSCASVPQSRRRRSRSGSRPLQVRAGSSTSASMVPRHRHSTAAGSPATSNECRDAERATSATHGMASWQFERERHSIAQPVADIVQCGLAAATR